jgi:hypothetical protein
MMNGTIRDYLHAPPVTAPPVTAPPVTAAANGVTVLIPTYTPADGDRTASLATCIGSALAAGRRGGDIPLAFLAVDNGLTQAAARNADELLRGSGRPYAIVRTASGPAGSRYTAAQARNAGLAFLSSLPASSPLVQGYLLFLDDDTALAPGSLARLRGALAARPEAIGACPRVVPVPDPAHWLATLAETGDAPAEKPRQLASPLCEGAYDLLSVTSHGSLVTGRTVGLLVRTDPVLSWVRVHGSLFYEDTPYGSCEDILVMAVLSRLGELWRVPGAMVADETRKTPGATLAQQFAWGYDHAWLAQALGEANLLDPGIHVLSWWQTGWQYAHADWGPHTGFLINPAELRLGYRLLDALGTDPGASAAVFGGRSRQVAAGTRLLGRVLTRWQADTGLTRPRHRPDLPPLASRDWTTMRSGVDSLIGHLAGNAAGSLQNRADHEKLPPFFLYGARQPAARESPAPGHVAADPAQLSCGSAESRVTRGQSRGQSRSEPRARRSG